MRGAELLRRADVVIYDLLSELALSGSRARCRKSFRAASAPEFSQEQINSLMVEKAREGKIIVRLKGGDPYIFGRGGEEAEALAAAKNSF